MKIQEKAIKDQLNKTSSLWVQQLFSNALINLTEYLDLKCLTVSVKRASLCLRLLSLHPKRTSEERKIIKRFQINTILKNLYNSIAAVKVKQFLEGDFYKADC